MTPSLLPFGFHVTQEVLNRNMNGVSDEDSLKPPAPAGNCINWIVGHLLCSRFGMLYPHLGLQAPISQEELAPYRMGSGPLPPGAKVLPLSRLKEAFAESNEQVATKLATLTPDDLARPLDPKSFPFPIEEPTFGKLLTLFSFHEAYHGGQVGLGRRLLGMPAGM